MLAIEPIRQRSPEFEERCQKTWLI